MAPNLEDATEGAGEPYRPLGLAELLRAAGQGLDLTPLGAQLVRYLETHDEPDALLELALVLELKYQPEAAAQVQQLALANRQHYVPPRAASPGAPRLLVLKTPGDLIANTPFECLIERADLHVDVLYVDDALPLPAALPPHDVLLVAACASDANAPRLARMAALAARSPRPLINAPQRIGSTAREAAFALLGDQPGIRMAETVRVPRERLADAARDGAPVAGLNAAYPLIVRPVGSHAGRGLVRIDAPADFDAYLQAMAGEAFYVAPFVDYRSDDGLYRKYRIVMCDGVPLVCHMGISSHWIVHYPYAEMAGDTSRRDEEAHCFASFDADFAVRHREAFARIAARTGLDYVGLDCAETRDGALLIFETATAMVVHDIDDPALYPYKLPQMQRVFDAFLAMITRRAALSDAAGFIGSPDVPESPESPDARA
ncbi:ATP-grasp domain-containing protein [Burkholderia sp. 3C]